MDFKDDIETILRQAAKLPGEKDAPECVSEDPGFAFFDLPLTPRGCPSPEALERHCLSERVPAIESHVRDCWLCQRASALFEEKAKRPKSVPATKQRRTETGLAKCARIFLDMLGGYEGRARRQLAYGFLFLLVLAPALLMTVVWDQGRVAGMRERLGILEPGIKNLENRLMLQQEAARLFNQSMMDVKMLLMAHTETTNDKLKKMAGKLEMVLANVEGSQNPIPLVSRVSVDKAGLEEAFRSDPRLREDYENMLAHWADAMVLLSDVLLQEGKIDMAIQVIERLRRDRPNDKPILYALGELWKMSAYTYDRNTPIVPKFGWILPTC